MQPPAGAFSPREPWGLYTPPPSAWKTWPKPRETNGESALPPSEQTKDRGRASLKGAWPFSTSLKSFLKVFSAVLFLFFLERMRVEYLTVQRALLPDSRIILELLVEFIDMILCTPQSNTNCTNSIQAVPSSTTSLILRIFPSVKLETRFETTTGRRRRRRSVAQTSIRLFRTFSHFLSKSKRTMRKDRTKLSYETPIHRFHQTWESFRRRWFKCLNDVLGTWISISGNINDRISIKGWE